MIKDILHQVRFKDSEVTTCESCGIVVPNSVAAFAGGDGVGHVIQIGPSWAPVMDIEVDGSNAVQCVPGQTDHNPTDLPEVELVHHKSSVSPKAPRTRTEREKAAVRQAFANWANVRALTRPEGATTSS
jgi:hypothetical protein